LTPEPPASYNVYDEFPKGVTGKERLMNKKLYRSPKVYELGNLAELTRENPDLDKCAGSNDQFVPQPPPLRDFFAGDCPPAP
jgi:hypothetical protein